MTALIDALLLLASLSLTFTGVGLLSLGFEALQAHLERRRRRAGGNRRDPQRRTRRRRLARGMTTGRPAVTG